jgi:hypothetical protein
MPDRRGTRAACTARSVARAAVAARLAASLAVALLAIAALVPAARADEGSGRVLVVGDSLEELTSPYLQHLLPGVPLTVNAVGGSNSFQIFDLFQESYDPSDSVIVFDAGTNDDPEYPQILAENLQKVAQTVGNRCIVVPTIHGFTVNGVDNAGKNRVVAEFAASRPGTQTPDWAGFVHTHPQLMQSDNLHPIEAGAQARAELIAAGISRCLSGAPNAPVASGANEGAIPPGDTGTNGEAEGELSQSHETFEPAAEASNAELGGGGEGEGPEPGSQPIAEAVHFKLVDRVAKRRAEVQREARDARHDLGAAAVLLARRALLH